MLQGLRRTTLASHPIQNAPSQHSGERFPQNPAPPFCHPERSGGSINDHSEVEGPPASSGVYAFVAHLDACAIGFNDASQQYPIGLEERTARLRAALLALAQTLLHPKGALTSTQLPHVLDLEGFVSISQSAAAARRPSS